MLVLTRKANESIVVDGRITVTILRVRGQVVRVGIDAPRDVSITRTELLEQGPLDLSPVGLCVPV